MAEPARSVRVAASTVEVEERSERAAPHCNASSRGLPDGDNNAEGNDVRGVDATPREQDVISDVLPRTIAAAVCSDVSTMLEAHAKSVNEPGGRDPEGTAGGAEAIRKRGKPNKAARKRNQLCLASQCPAAEPEVPCTPCGATLHFDAAVIEAAVAAESLEGMVEAVWPSWSIGRNGRESQQFLYEQLQTLRRASLRALTCGPTCNHSTCLRRPISELAATNMGNVGELLQLRRRDQHTW